MFEAEKTNRVRGPDFISRFMSGTVLDIGSGHNLVVPHARPFDKRHGDANRIASYLPAESFDCVHSSHVLEHMYCPRQALVEWWSLVKPGGYMVIVVPDENIYEQGHWPSLLNFDHKWTFRLDGAMSWSPVSLDVTELIEKLRACEVIEVTVQDDGYDYSLRDDVRPISHVTHLLSHSRKWIMQKMAEIGVPGMLHLERWCALIERRFGIPIDQTRFGALAQIQIVLCKRRIGWEACGYPS
jgi:SAM-dependent methyltransferase